VRNDFLGLNHVKPRKLFKYPSMPLTNDFLIRFSDKCDAFIDIGCNQGKFADHFEFINPNRPWALIEPIPELMNEIKKKFEDRTSTTLFFNTALGDFNGTTTFYITSNEGQSSSTLKLGEKHLEASPDALEVEELKVPIRTLNSLLPDFNYKNMFLKIDVQGTELQVLKSGVEFLKKVSAIHIEVSMQHLYEGDDLGFKIWEFLSDQGFYLYGIDPWFRSRNLNGELLQADFFFLRSNPN
jgi:FkbM family methyltransferase